MKDLANRLWGICDELRSQLAPMDSMKIVLYVLVLKKVVDRRLFITPDNMNQMLDLRDSISNFQTDGRGFEVFIKAGEMLETEYSLPKQTITNLFFMGSLSTINNENLEKIFQMVTYQIREFDMSYDCSEMKEAIDAFIHKCFQYVGKQSGESISSISLSKLLAGLADVQDGETLYDGSLGIGYSAVKCIEGKNAKLIGSELNQYTVTLAGLYLILVCEQDFEIENRDCTFSPNTESYNKVVMDIPFGVKGKYVGEQITMAKKWLGVEEGTDMDSLFVASAVNSMIETGRTVVVVPQGLLFKQNKICQNLKKNLCDRKMLKAVISLPPVHYSMGVKSAIIVLEKNCSDTMMIEGESFFTKEGRNAVLTDETVRKICNIIDEGTELKGVSRCINLDDIFQNNYDISPVKYVAVYEEKSYRTIDEINTDLNKKMAEFNSLVLDMGQIKMFN